RLRLASRATSLRSVVPQHDRASVHGALPGGLVYRRPSAPAATHKPPPKVTFDIAAPPKLSIPRLQLRPSVLVDTLPSVPTATHTPLSNATPAMSELPKPLVRWVHEIPSGLVRSVPPAPTVTQRPPPNATSARSRVPRGLALGSIVADEFALALTLGLALRL